MPPDWGIPVTVKRHFNDFQKSVSALFHKSRGRPNLLQYQHCALSFIGRQNDFLIISWDKNLDPAIIEKDVYIKRALSDHLNDANTYQPLSKMHAKMMEGNIRNDIKGGLKQNKKELPPTERKFIK